MQHESMPVGFVVVFYGLVGALAWFLATTFGDLNLLIWHDAHGTSVYLDAAVGIGAGVVVVAASSLLDRYAEWSRRLSREFGRLLGPLTITDAFVFALASAMGEELFFRGFLQQVLTDAVFEANWADWAGLATTTLVFGLLHIGPKVKTMWPWTVFAIVLGAGLGGMYLYTGNLLAPIVAHFTINFFNLQSIGRKYGHLRVEHGQQ